MICLLDSDFWLGVSPSEIFKLCILNAGNREIRFIAEWDGNENVAIGPEISIMSKSFLFGFCRYVITDYYSANMRNTLIGEYFDRIGHGLKGGICDMRALSSYSKCHANNIFNLRDLNKVEFIRSFNDFLKSEVGKGFDWRISYRDKKQLISIKNVERTLLGTHFQGTAKIHMKLINKKNKVISKNDVLINLKNEKKIISRSLQIFMYLVNQIFKILKN